MTAAAMAAAAAAAVISWEVRIPHDLDLVIQP